MNAVIQLNASGQYDRFVGQYAQQFPRVAGSSQWLPYLRELLFRFENAVQAVEASATVPYWDAQRDYAAPEKSAVLGPGFVGGNGDSRTGVVASAGRFGAWQVSVPERHQLRRKFERGDRISGWASPAAVSSFLANTTTYHQLRPGIEYQFSGPVHTGIGGDMAGRYAPADPVFWLHIANVDRLWSVWQSRAGNMAQYDGPNADASSAKVTDRIVGSDSVTVKDVLDISALGYRYV
ncbi:tyrosinase family protein [Nocardia sp. JMUB6875]|uniref:tyrosinase family protein n=1 Tax=Nocardia sp. JMUB6875 TaxID=3158170 RepID=UPI0034E8F499